MTLHLRDRSRYRQVSLSPVRRKALLVVVLRVLLVAFLHLLILDMNIPRRRRHSYRHVNLLLVHRISVLVPVPLAVLLMFVDNPTQLGYMVWLVWPVHTHALICVPSNEMQGGQ